MYFNNGGSFSVTLDLNIQKIWESFYPLGVQINPGEYTYLMCSATYQTDLSKKFSMELSPRFGNYYDGSLAGIQGRFTAAPIPYISVAANYSYTKLKNLGAEKTDVDVFLFAPEVCLALNPKLNLSLFYQKNTRLKQDNWNARFTWEFKPMSFLYLVFSSNSGDDAGQLTHNNQMLGKITFLQRF